MGVGRGGGGGGGGGGVDMKGDRGVAAVFVRGEAEE